jgi:hypothetical protein
MSIQDISSKPYQCRNKRQEETAGAIKNGQSRDTGNINHTRHRTKTNKTQKLIS